MRGARHNGQLGSCMQQAFRYQHDGFFTQIPVSESIVQIVQQLLIDICFLIRTFLHKGKHIGKYMDSDLGIKLKVGYFRTIERHQLQNPKTDQGNLIHLPHLAPIIKDMKIDPPFFHTLYDFV
jgi:hypothetical protein